MPADYADHQQWSSTVKTRHIASCKDGHFDACAAAAAAAAAAVGA
jgi:hypothetical protein